VQSYLVVIGLYLLLAWFYLTYFSAHSQTPPTLTNGVALFQVPVTFTKAIASFHSPATFSLKPPRATLPLTKVAEAS
jgi:hypothetical protein